MNRNQQLNQLNHPSNQSMNQWISRKHTIFNFFCIQPVAHCSNCGPVPCSSNFPALAPTACAASAISLTSPETTSNIQRSGDTGGHNAQPNMGPHDIHLTFIWHSYLSSWMNLFSEQRENMDSAWFSNPDTGTAERLDWCSPVCWRCERTPPFWSWDLGDVWTPPHPASPAVRLVRRNKSGNRAVGTAVPRQWCQPTSALLQSSVWPASSWVVAAASYH